MQNKIILYGASGHGVVVADILESEGGSDIVFYDDHKIEDFHRYRILNSIEENKRHLYIITIGSNDIRKKIVETHCFHYTNAIHPSGFIAKSVQMGYGNVIMAGSNIGVLTKIGNHCIINTGANIDHECYLEDYCHISPGVSLAGDVFVGEGAHIGIGASVIQGIKIGRWATIGAGAVVIRDVPEYATAVGVPAKIIKIAE